MPPQRTPTLRSLRAEDIDAARELIDRTLSGTAYEGRALELLEEAAGGSVETRGMVMVGRTGVSALALYGAVQGSVAWTLDVLLLSPTAQPDTDGAPLVEAIADAARAAGAGQVVAEMPADGVIGRTLSLLRASGFRQPGRVKDYYRDGVDLLFLVRRL